MRFAKIILRTRARDGSEKKHSLGEKRANSVKFFPFYRDLRPNRNERIFSCIRSAEPRGGGRLFNTMKYAACQLQTLLPYTRESCRDIICQREKKNK